MKKLLIPIVELALSIVAIISGFTGFIDLKLIILGVILLLSSGVTIQRIFNTSDMRENHESQNNSLDMKVESKAFIIAQGLNVIMLLVSILLYHVGKGKFFAVIIAFSIINLIVMFILEIFLAFYYSKKFGVKN